MFLNIVNAKSKMLTFLNDTKQIPALMSGTLDPADVLYAGADPVDVYLNEKRTAWIRVQRLDIGVDFDAMFESRPAERVCVTKMEADGSLIDTPRQRFQKCFGKTPPLMSESMSKWYMFGTQHEVLDTPIPDTLQPLCDAASAAESVPFNQIVLTWYEGKQDYMQCHRDWSDGLKADAPISTLTLTKAQVPEECRKIGFFPVNRASRKGCAYPKGLFVVLRHGVLVSMHGCTNKNFRHGIMHEPMNERLLPRIGVTFRCYEDV